MAYPAIDPDTDFPPVNDPLSFFRYEWGIYQKLVRSNAMCHEEISKILRWLIDDRFGQAIDFIDVACGDASVTTSILENKAIRTYTGIDLNEQALHLAAARLKNVPYSVALHHEEMVGAMKSRPNTADMIWCGFSVHHLETLADKQEMLTAVRRALKPGGVFVCFEPTCHPGESRPDYINRCQSQVRQRFGVLTDREYAHMWNHIREHDFPVTGEDWVQLGRNAGFRASREIFRMPGDLFCAAYYYES